MVVGGGRWQLDGWLSVAVGGLSVVFGWWVRKTQWAVGESGAKGDF